MFDVFGSNYNSGGLNTSTLNFAQPFAASKLSFFGAAGDGMYSVSEVSVLGVSAVPEPETYAMFLAGLGLMGFMSRRRSMK